MDGKVGIALIVIIVIGTTWIRSNRRALRLSGRTERDGSLWSVPAVALVEGDNVTLLYLHELARKVWASVTSVAGTKDRIGIEVTDHTTVVAWIAADRSVHRDGAYGIVVASVHNGTLGAALHHRDQVIVACVIGESSITRNHHLLTILRTLERASRTVRRNGACLATEIDFSITVVIDTVATLWTRNTRDTCHHGVALYRSAHEAIGRSRCRVGDTCLNTRCRRICIRLKRNLHALTLPNGERTKGTNDVASVLRTARIALCCNKCGTWDRGRNRIGNTNVVRCCRTIVRDRHGVRNVLTALNRRSSCLGDREIGRRRTSRIQSFDGIHVKPVAWRRTGGVVARIDNADELCPRKSTQIQRRGILNTVL